jgi:hypothetical protein
VGEAGADCAQSGEEDGQREQGRGIRRPERILGQAGEVSVGVGEAFRANQTATFQANRELGSGAD